MPPPRPHKPPSSHQRPPLSAPSQQPAERPILAEIADSWVSDCTIFHAIGGVLSAFKKHRTLLDAFHRAEAAFLMYSEGTRHAGGPDPKVCLLLLPPPLPQAPFCL